MQNNPLILAAVLMGLFVVMGCGEKRYDEPERCDDLSTIYFTEQDASLWSPVQLAAVERFESLQGTWQVQLNCLGLPLREAVLTITEALPSNVELYETTENAQCDALGEAIFEARISGSGDADLDNIDFTMTASLVRPNAPGDKLLEAWSEEFLSQQADVAAFSLNVYITKEGEKVATRQVTMAPEVTDGGSVSVTLRNDCFLTDWQAL